jgi:hypothetical protein
VKIRRKKGTFSALLVDVEVALLNTMLDELDELVDAVDAQDPITQRLFPAGYLEDVDAADFRDLTQRSLQQERRDRYGECRAELALSRETAAITTESAARWVIVINDMRLALGTRLGVTADGFADTDTGNMSPAAAPDPQQEAQAVYHWLTAVQDELVQQLNSSS